jgi:hypothetical protein
MLDPVAKSEMSGLGSAVLYVARFLILILVSCYYSYHYYYHNSTPYYSINSCARCARCAPRTYPHVPSPFVFSKANIIARMILIRSLMRG